MNVLELSEHELRALSTEELEDLLDESAQQESLFDTRQQSEKLLINSLYGALGNRWFPLFNQDIARSITGNGRYFIKKMSNYIEDELQRLLPLLEGTKYGIYNDTDSVVGSTMIDTSEGRISIEDLYHTTSGNIDILGVDNYVKHLSEDISAKSFCTRTENIQHKHIKYVMAHKVKKRMFRITHNEVSVTVTEDHSIIILRNGEYIDVKPSDITSSDKIIVLV